ncbi:MAG TPA: AarF/ABC1/UbiB kinase family protein [Gemmatimonadaceae bacterium]|nr:AarF/ABC1/UbiB kinase family protein [Gemmatimonadaceae bacterium]
MSSRDGPARRALRMAAMSAGVSGSYLGYLAQSAFLTKEKKQKKLGATHTRAARRVTEGMIALKGPAMKLGQALSLHTNFLPPETIAELSTLQMKAPGMHPSLVSAHFKANMGVEPEKAYRSFTPKPFAAASLGQVHRAVLKSGEKVAVKIQYPGIRDAIESDFKWFRAASKPAQLSHHIPEFALDELQEQIVAECDYVREADNAEFFRARLARLPYVEVPQIHRELSSDKVLTMSVVRGEHIDAFLAKRPARKLRDLVGERLFELFYFQFLEMNALHADPHWGNYLFRNDGTIGLVDFGCVKYFQPSFVANLRKMFLYEGPRDSANFRRVLEERYNERHMKLSKAAHAAFASMSENFYARVYPPRIENDSVPFDFGDPSFLNDFIRESAKVAKAKGALPEYVLLVRAETGLYQTLHRLKARVHTSAILRKWLVA